jgi:hypothetical protein
MKKIVAELPKNKDSHELVASVKQGLREVTLIRKGKLPKKPIQKLLRDI